MNWKALGLGALLLVTGAAAAQAELPPVADLEVTGRPLYMKLEWSPVDTTMPGQLAYYKVYRSETAGVLGDSIGFTTEVTYGDTTCTYHVFYWYEVHPVDVSGAETMAGNNQVGDSLLTLGDPAVEITSHPACFVQEEDEAELSGTWQWAIDVEVNGYTAWMTLDPTFETGEWLTTVPLDMGPNAVVALATGTEGRAADDSIWIARIPEGSGDPSLVFTSHVDGDFVVDPEVDLEGEVHNGACVSLNGGDYLDLVWEPAYDMARWATAASVDYGANVLSAHALGSLGREASASLTLYRVAAGAPDVEITLPEDLLVTEDLTVTVEGTCFAVGWVELNGEEVTVDFDPDGSGTWAHEDFALELGANVITAVGFGFATNDTATVTVYRVEPPPNPPSIEITSPEDNLITTEGTVDVAGTSQYCGYIMLNGYSVEPDVATGAWGYLGFPLVEGWNTIVAVGYGANDQTASDSVMVYYFVPPVEPPGVEITSPEDQDIFDYEPISVSGTSGNCAYLVINEETVYPDVATGDWSYEGYPLELGPNTVTVTGYGADDQTATASVTVYYVTGTPSVDITSPEDDDVFGVSDITVAGTSENCAYLTIDGDVFYPDEATGDWSYSPYSLEPGWNTIEVTGYGANDQTASDAVTVFYDDTPGAPSVEITSPEDGAATLVASVDVEGTSDNCAYLMLNGYRIDPEADGGWYYDDYPLVEGDNVITVTGYGIDDQTATDQVTVTLLGGSPEVSITSPEDGVRIFEDNVDVTGTSQYCLYLEINGETVTPAADGSWSYDNYPLELGLNTITVTGYGGDDETATDQVTVTRAEPEEYSHHKIFTPNGDGYNDHANFDVESGATVKIYALDGQLVVELDELETGPDGYVIRWDGKDRKDKDAPAGLYIYEIVGGDEEETGTIGLAR